MDPPGLYSSQIKIAARHVCYNSQACSLLVSLSARLEEHIQTKDGMELLLPAAALRATKRCLRDVRDYILSVSGRGWFRRILNQALCSADVTNILTDLFEAAAGVGLHLDCPESLVGDEDAIRAVIDNIDEGLDGAVSDKSIETQVELSNLMTEESIMMLPDILLEEQLVAEASTHLGGHWALRNCDLQTFWFAAFGQVEEVLWSQFWSQFPAKVHNSLTKNALSDLFASHCQKKAFQRILLTVDSCYISTAELDLHFLPDVDLVDSCTAIFACQNKNDYVQSKLQSQPNDNTQMAISPSPIVAKQIQMDILKTPSHSLEPVRLVQLIGPEGTGKRKAAGEVADMLITHECWSRVITVDFKWVRSVSHFQGLLLTAFGMSPVKARLTGLLAHLKRYYSSPHHRLCLTLLNIGHLLEAEPVEDQFEHILVRMLQHATGLQMITTSQRPFSIGDQKTFVYHIHAPTVRQAEVVLDFSDERIFDAINHFGTFPSTVQLLAELLRDQYCPLRMLLNGTATFHRLLRMILGGLPASYQYALCCLTTFPAQFEMDGAEAVLAETLSSFQVSQLVKEMLQLRLMRQDKQLKCWFIEPVRAALILICEDQELDLEQARSAYRDFVLSKLATAEALQQVAPMTSARLICQRHVDIVKALQQEQPPEGGCHRIAGLVDLISNFVPDKILTLFCEDCFSMAHTHCNQALLQRAAWQLALLHYNRDRGDLARLYMLQGQCNQHLQPAEIVVYYKGAARNCMKLQLFQDARSLLERAFSLLSTDAKWEHLSILSDHAIVLQQLGFAGEAADIIETFVHTRCCAQSMKCNQCNCLNFAKSLGSSVMSMVLIHTDSGFLNVISDVGCGPQRQWFIAALAALASAYSQIQQYSDAELFLRQCLRLQQDDLGSKHVKALALSGDLATLLLRSGHPGEAKKLLQYVLAEYLDRFGPFHTQVAKIRNQLAGC